MGHFPEDERPVEMMGDADEATEPGTAEGEPAESPPVEGPEPTLGEDPEPPASPERSGKPPRVAIPTGTP